MSEYLDVEFLKVMHKQLPLVFTPMYQELFLGMLDAIQKHPDQVAKMMKMLEHIDKYFFKENPKIAAAHVILALLLLKTAGIKPLEPAKETYDEIVGKHKKKSDVMYR